MLDCIELPKYKRHTQNSASERTTCRRGVVFYRSKADLRDGRDSIGNTGTEEEDEPLTDSMSSWIEEESA